MTLELKSTLLILSIKMGGLLQKWSQEKFLMALLVLMLEKGPFMCSLIAKLIPQKFIFTLLNYYWSENLFEVMVAIRAVKRAEQRI